MVRGKLLDQVRRFLPSGRDDTEKVSFVSLFRRFREILEINNRVLEKIAEANDALGGDYIFDRNYIETVCREIPELVFNLLNDLDAIAPRKYASLFDAFRRIRAEINRDLAGRMRSPVREYVLFYEDIGRDFADAVGGKSANISELHNFLNVRIPAGFAVTTAAFEAFWDRNDLRHKIDKLLKAWQDESLDLETAAAKIRKLILAGSLPSRLEKELIRAVNRLRQLHKDQPLFLAVRSSALGEDSEYSFAGQYHSLLNVPADEVADAYHQVIAGAYGAGALAYRRRMGFDEGRVRMAVACQIMVEVEAGGVLYTLDPADARGSSMVLGSTWGLGLPVVSGKSTGDRFVMDRQPPHQVTEMQLVRKDKALRAVRKGGTAWQPVAVDWQTLASLTEKQIKQVAETGLIIEHYFKKPQDIEFAFTKLGELVILQTRNLHLKPARVPRAEDLVRVLERYPVLLRNQGEIAQKGVGSGKVCFVSNDTTFSEVPAGAVAVARYASPQLAKLMPKISAFLADVGATTGHLATIAREFRVPCLMNIGNATTLLRPGQEITVDADVNIVYEGLVSELCFYGLTEDAIEESPEYTLLRSILKKIAPLNLLDPSEQSFRPESCRTLHDIIRFVHEKAVDELIDQSVRHQQHHLAGATGRLRWSIPLDLILIDIGGGLRAGSGDELTPESIASTPMQALLKGLAQPGSWNNDPASIDLEGFMSSLTRTFSPELANPQYVGQNLAVISKDYANVSLRLGYHFSMIDSYVTEDITSNYAYFRFFGGVSDLTRRSRRVKFLGRVLADHDFRIELHGDLMVARLKKLDKQGMLDRLYLLGLLVGFTRQLDVKMHSEQHVENYVKKFNELLEKKV